jgi:hypothetical protein
MSAVGRARGGARAVVIAMASVLAAGCSGAAAVAEPPIGPIAAITRESQVTRPIDAYLPTVGELRGLWQARSDAAAACYAEHGTPGRTSVPPDLVGQLRSGRQDDIARSRLYGLFDAQGASEYGYGPALETHVLGMPAPSASPGVVRTCEKAGDDAIVDLKLVTDERILPDGGPTLARSDSRFRKTVASWSECMHKAGYNYDDPIAPLTDPKWRRPVAEDGSQAPPTSAEIAAATADVKCKVSTDLVGVALAVQSAYDQRYIESHRDQLAEFKRFVGGSR